jgi:hypothetical protein
MMERVFALLFRLGRFPQPPSTVLQPDRNGEPGIDLPQVVYQGRIAMIMRRLQSEGIARTLQRLQVMAGLDNALVDHIDLDRTFRMAARMDGAPEGLLRPEAGVKRMRRKRETTAEQQPQPASPNV